VAPALVFLLVISSIANQSNQSSTLIRPIIILYLIGTFAAAVVAVILSFAFPVKLTLIASQTPVTPPEGVLAVLNTMLFKVVQNPITALLEGNYLSILAWAIGLGITLRNANQTTKTVLHDLATAITQVVRFIIQFAPVGIFGLVAGTIAMTGFVALLSYLKLIILLVSAMLIVALLVNPLIVFLKTKSNPYPLVFRCLKESGITAFFTRSSAANIPVNLKLCKDLGLHEDTYSISIPLGATVNMAGAVITITIMTLAAAQTVGIEVTITTALLLCLIAAVSACGSSGVAGGSLLLIPVACSLFGIQPDTAAQVVGVGFVISVIQDSAETALNSSTDVIFTAAACADHEYSQVKLSSAS